MRVVLSVFLLWILAWPCGLFGQGGFRPVIGELPADSGFALGVGYRKEQLSGGAVDIDAKAILSVKRYEHLELQVKLPRLANRRFFAEFGAQYRNYPEENFWGLGPNSDEGLRTNFRLEDVTISGSGGYRPIDQIRIGATTGYLQANTGPGKDSGSPTVEHFFSPAQVPGLARQPDYLFTGAFVEFNSLDVPHDPREGGFYQFRWTNYDDRDFDAFSFRRYELTLHRFFPVFRKRGTVAARGLLSLTDTSPGQQIPFFMQQTVGGSADVRGYGQYRFRDANRVVFNLEYRWAMVEFFDLVAFGDAGKVFSRRDEFGLDDLRGSLGVGGRLKFRGRVLLGFDLGYSPEGLRFWLRGSHTF